MVVLPYTKEQYDRIFAAAGREDLLGDERYATGRQRIANAGFLYDLVGQMLASRTTAEWLAFPHEQDVPAGEVASLDDLVDQLPRPTTPTPEPTRWCHRQVRFARAPQNVRRPAPLIGEHTAAVLAEVGYDEGRLAGLRASGALARFPPSFPERVGADRAKVADDHDRHEQPVGGEDIEVNHPSRTGGVPARAGRPGPG